MANFIITSNVWVSYEYASRGRVLYHLNNLYVWFKVRSTAGSVWERKITLQLPISIWAASTRASRSVRAYRAAVKHRVPRRGPRRPSARSGSSGRPGPSRTKARTWYRARCSCLCPSTPWRSSRHTTASYSASTRASWCSHLTRVSLFNKYKLLLILLCL